MNALVTGASGIVGANLVRELLAAQWNVRALVRRGPTRRALVGLPIEVVPGDVLDPASLAGAVSGMDIVFHAAARFAYAAPDQEKLERLAIDGTCNVIAAAAAAKVRRVVLTSSSVIFGSSATAEVRDESSPFTREDASRYALSKMRQTAAAFVAAAANKLELVAVCPTLTIGAWDYGLSQSNAIIVNYLNDPFRATFPGGGNMVSARDVARGHILVAEHGNDGESYVLGADNLHWRDLHAEISAICGTHGPLMTATHTGAYLAAAWGEWMSRWTGVAPALTRDEVKMMGRWYWYADGRARALGYRPAPTHDALRDAITWLLRTDHIRPDVRAVMRVLEPAPAAT